MTADSTLQPETSPESEQGAFEIATLLALRELSGGTPLRDWHRKVERHAKLNFYLRGLLDWLAWARSQQPGWALAALGGDLTEPSRALGDLFSLCDRLSHELVGAGHSRRFRLSSAPLSLQQSELKVAPDDPAERVIELALLAALWQAGPELRGLLRQAAAQGPSGTSQTDLSLIAAQPSRAEAAWIRMLRTQTPEELEACARDTEWAAHLVKRAVQAGKNTVALNGATLNIAQNLPPNDPAEPLRWPVIRRALGTEGAAADPRITASLRRIGAALRGLGDWGGALSAKEAGERRLADLQGEALYQAWAARAGAPLLRWIDPAFQEASTSPAP